MNIYNISYNLWTCTRKSRSPAIDAAPPIDHLLDCITSVAYLAPSKNEPRDLALKMKANWVCIVYTFDLLIIIIIII